MLSSKLKDFTRGGQTTMHAIRMFIQSVRYIVYLSGCLCLGLFVWNIYCNTTKYDWYIASKKIEAEVRNSFDKNSSQKIITIRNKQIKMRAVDFVSHPNTKRHCNNIIYAIRNATVYSLLLAAGIFLTLIVVFIKRGFKFRRENKIRGTKILAQKDLIKLIKKQKMASNLTLAEVPLVKNSEVQHILINGSIGTGKSVAIMELMDEVRAKEQRAVVFDIDGNYVSTYYRKDKDILLNPFDQRTVNWDVFQECEDSADFEAYAESLMPTHLSNSDPFWVNSARTIFATAAFKMSKQKDPKIKDLLGALFCEDLGQIIKLVRNTVAESLVSEKIEKTALSIKATLSTYCKSMLYLPEQEDSSIFSIRKWLQQDNSDSWLFIASNEKKFPAIRPLVTSWLDIASREVLSLPQSFDRKIWFFMDELHSLNKLPSLMGTLSKGRKHGACFVGVLQDIHMLHEVYGPKAAESLLALFNTLLCFRTPNANSARWVMNALGSREITEQKEGISYGANEIRDGVTIHQERRKEAVIIDSEILHLDNLQAFLSLAGNLPVAKVTFKVKNRNAIAEAELPRETVDISLVNKSIAKEQKLPATPAASHRSKTINTSNTSGKSEIKSQNNNSVFMAIASGLVMNSSSLKSENIKELGKKLRSKTVDFLISGGLRKNLEQLVIQKDTVWANSSQYIKELQSGAVGGVLEIKALSRMLQINIVCYLEDGNIIYEPRKNCYEKDIYIRQHHNQYSLVEINTNSSAAGDEITDKKLSATAAKESLDLQEI